MSSMRRPVIFRALSSAVQTLYNEKQKIDGSLKKQAGIAGEYAIDFDAARREMSLVNTRARLRMTTHPVEFDMYYSV